MAPTDPRCTIGSNIQTKAVHVTSLAECSRRYGANKKTRILVGTVLEVEIGPKATALGRRRTFVVTTFDLGGGDMKVDIINIRSVKLHTLELLLPATDGDGDGDGGERAASTTMTNTGDTNITDPVSVKVFEAPAPDPLHHEAFRVVVAHPIAENARPAALSIGRDWRVGGGGCFTPCDGCIYCGDAYTSSTSSISSSSSTSSSIASHTGSA